MRMVLAVPIHEGAACHLEQLVEAIGGLSLPPNTVLAVDINNSSPIFYEQVQRLLAYKLRHLSPMIHYEPKSADVERQECELNLVFRPGSGHGAMVEGGGVKSRRITESRERLRGIALSLDADYIYWCDSDMVPPPDAVSELLASGEDYVSALCHVRQSNPPTVSAWTYESPNIYDDGNRVTVSTQVPNKLPVGRRVLGGSLPLSNLMGSIVYWHGEESGVVEVDGVGLAATIVHRDVFSRVDFDVSHQLADDAQFAMKAKEEGFGVYLHTGVYVPHVDEDGTVY